MKLLSFLAVLLLSAAVSHAQSYSLAAATVNGGGGVSSGSGAAGTFTLTGAIAQQAWNASTGGTYSLSGGFFSQYYALQREGAPPLTIRRSGANVQVVWASSVPGWILQQNTADLGSANWVDVAASPTVSGNEQYQQFPAGSGRVFYRLRKL